MLPPVYGLSAAAFASRTGGREILAGREASMARLCRERVQVMPAPVAAREVSRSNRGRRLAPREGSRSETDVLGKLERDGQCAVQVPKRGTRELAHVVSKNGFRQADELVAVDAAVVLESLFDPDGDLR